MNKLVIFSMLALALMVSPAFAINYDVTPASPITIDGIGNTATILIALHALPAGIITAGFWFDGYNASIVDVDTAPGSVQIFDGVHGPPGPWDPGFGITIVDPAGPATLFVAVANYSTVPPGNNNLAIVRLKGIDPGSTTINITTIPGFETVVGDSTVYDPQIAALQYTVYVMVPPCVCSITGPATVEVSTAQPGTAQYTAAPVVPTDCANPPVYVWSDTCILGDVDQTGLLTVPPTTSGENCLICAVDTANTDNHTLDPVACCYQISIAPGCDTDGDGVCDNQDNCPNTPNQNQLDSYPPQGNGIGNACECEGNFNCSEDQDVDGTDAATFKVDFGRSSFQRPCIDGDSCNGDFSCDGDVDGTDAALFKQDFGRSSFQNPCPSSCGIENWCPYAGGSTIYLCTEADCPSITWTLGGRTHPDTSGCNTTAGFSNVAEGNYPFSASGCGYTWESNVYIDGQSPIALVLCPAGTNLGCCASGCGVGGGFNCAGCP